MTYRKKEPGKGSKRPGDTETTQIVVRMDDETFQQVRARAIAEQTSIAHQLRLLIEWGLEAEAAQ